MTESKLDRLRRIDRRVARMVPRPMFRRTGPGRQSCQLCGWSGSTNALARASHERGQRHQAALDDIYDKAERAESRED